MGQYCILSRFKDGDQPSVFPRCKKVMDKEMHIENLDQEGKRSLEKILQGPVRDTVSPRSLVELKTQNSCVNL